MSKTNLPGNFNTLNVTERPSDRLLHFSQNTHPTKNVITDVQISFDYALYNIWFAGSLWHPLFPTLIK